MTLTLHDELHRWTLEDEEDWRDVTACPACGEHTVLHFYGGLCGQHGVVTPTAEKVELVALVKRGRFTCLIDFRGVESTHEVIHVWAQPEASLIGRVSIRRLIEQHRRDAA